MRSRNRTHVDENVACGRAGGVRESSALGGGGGGSSTFCHCLM